METDWMGEGRCKDMDPAVFFPSDWIGVQSAQRICSACTVKDRCLGYALANRITYGVWGGASERLRRRLVRSRGPTQRDVAESSETEPASTH